MRHEIRVPRLSETVEEGVLVTWFVESGQLVRSGDRVAEVQVEKMASEVTSPVDGRVTELLGAPGDVVVQGALLAVIEFGGAGRRRQRACIPGRQTAGQGARRRPRPGRR